MNGNNICLIIVSIISITFIIVLLLTQSSNTRVNEKWFDMTSQLIGEKQIDKRYNIAIVTLETRNLKINPIHNENIKYYANKHGYTYIFLKNYQNIEIELPVYWKKLQLVLELLQKYDYILWLDSDTLVCHPEIRLERIISEDPNKSIFIGKDYPGDSENAFCAGIFMIKNDVHGNGFLKDCIELYIKDKNCQENGKYTLKGAYAGNCYEQGVMNIFLKGKYKKYLCHLKWPYIVNSTHAAFAGFLVHMYGDKNVIYDQFQSFVKNHVEMIPLEPVKNKLNIAIILTLSSVSSERVNLYTRNIKKWLKTGLDIYTVDSFGDNIKIDGNYSNYFPLHFKQKDRDTKSSSQYESDSLAKVLANYRYLKNYDLIFKITGKYFIPKFKDQINYFPDDSELIVQNNTHTYGQNCEIFGAKFNILKTIIYSDYNLPLELRLFNIVKNKKWKTYRMRPLKPSEKVKRGDGSVLNYL